MEFNIRKKATLPYLEVNLLKDGKTDYNYLYTDFSNTNIYFYMKDVDTNFYKVAKGVCVFSNEYNTIYYQFTKKNTSTTGRYEGFFKIINQQGEVELPLREKLYINILESISEVDFCCK